MTNIPGTAGHYSTQQATTTSEYKICTNEALIVIVQLSVFNYNAEITSTLWNGLNSGKKMWF